MSPPVTSTLPKPPPTETAAIIVQNTIYPSITAAVTQYRQDLNDSGYNTILYTQPLTNAHELKGNLTHWYHTAVNFVGAVLIGRLPYAQFYHPARSPFSSETFICDLYLEDLDGSWWDINPQNGVFDKHNASVGADIYPEIFIGRIDSQCLVDGTISGPGGTTADYLNLYFARLHTYRTGGVQRQRRALSYIDDDWFSSAYTFNSAVQKAYSTTTLIYHPASTTATDWLNNQLPSNYQWAHLCAHSSTTTHYFGPSGSGDGTSSSTQIANVPPAFNFYNLFCCSGTEWTANNNLGVTYLFNSSYSVGVVGSAKTGGMLGNNDFYTPLGLNKTLGESLQNWFSNQLNTAGAAGSSYLEWFYGMNIIGDPFATIWYDNTVLPPVISSTTHNPATWSPITHAQFNWTVPVDVNSIVGYYYILDQNPNTIPTASTGTFTTINGTQIPQISDGTWYLHVVAKDGAGNVGTVADHYQVNIDAMNPTVQITNPSSGSLITNDYVQLTWTVTETGSGYHQAQIMLDTVLIATVTNYSISVTGLTNGTHTLNVTAYDHLGKSGFKCATFSVNSSATTPPPSPPPIPGFTFSAVILGVSLAVGPILLRRRKHNS
jgi:hypothetical protein